MKSIIVILATLVIMLSAYAYKSYHVDSFGDWVYYQKVDPFTDHVTQAISTSGIQDYSTVSARMSFQCSGEPIDGDPKITYSLDNSEIFATASTRVKYRIDKATTELYEPASHLEPFIESLKEGNEIIIAPADSDLSPLLFSLDGFTDAWNKLYVSCPQWTAERKQEVETKIKQQKENRRKQAARLKKEKKAYEQELIKPLPLTIAKPESTKPASIKPASTKPAAIKPASKAKKATKKKQTAPTKENLIAVEKSKQAAIEAKKVLICEQSARQNICKISSKKDRQRCLKIFYDKCKVNPEKAMKEIDELTVR